MNKTLLSLLILTIFTGASLYYLNNQAENPTFDQNQGLQAITPRTFFRGATYGLTDSLDEFVSQVLSYGIKYTSTLDELAEGSSENESKTTSNTVQITAQCYVQSKFIEAENLLEIAVQYTSIDKILTGTDSNTENLQQNYEEKEEQSDLKLAPPQIYEEVELEDFYDPEVETTVQQKQDYFYLVFIDIDSGKIQKVERENAFDEDPSLTWITQQLINDIFPDSRVESYATPQIERDNLGDVLVEYKHSKLGDEYAYLTRDYDSNDLINPIVTNVKNPEIDYDRDVIVEYNSGIVTGGNSDFIISVGNEQLDLQQYQDNEEDYQQVIFGENMNGKINQEFWKIDVSDDNLLENIGYAMQQYRNKADLVNVFLYNYDSAVVLYGTGENEPDMEIVDIDTPDQEEIIEITGADIEGQPDYKLQNLLNQGLSMTPPSIQETNSDLLGDSYGNIYRESTLAQLKVFGSKLKIDFTFQGNAFQSNVNVAAKVNSHTIKKFINVDFNACKSHQKSIDYDSQDVTLFTAIFPVFGIITINVSVRTRIQYGLEYSTAGMGGQCTMNVQPWMRTALYADGKASLAGIISAGIYAQGTFLDANLQFGASVNQAEFNAQLVGNFQSAQTEVGLVYSKLKCSLKNVLGEGEEEVEEQQQLEEVKSENEDQFRRNLGLRKRIKKAARKVTHVVKKAVQNIPHVIENTVHKVVNNAVQQAVKLEKKIEQKAVQVVQKAVKKTVTKVINGVEQKFTQVVQQAQKVVKTVQDVAKVVQNVTKICSLQKGYKQLSKSSSREYKKVIFDLNIKF